MYGLLHRCFAVAAAHVGNIECSHLLFLFVFLQIDPPQAEGVGDNRDGGQAHRRRCDHRGEQKAVNRVQQTRRNRHAKSIIGEREEQVLLDVARRHPRKFARPNDAYQVTTQKGYPG